MNAKPEKIVDPRMHSAEHILTATVMRMTGCGRPVATHIEKKKSKADYRVDRGFTADEVLELERRVNEVIRAGLEVREEFLGRAEAARVHNLERLPVEAGENVRIVHIGDYDACPCIGPHVGNTREIGCVKVVSTTFEAGVLRVRFKVRDPSDGT